MAADAAETAVADATDANFINRSDDRNNSHIVIFAEDQEPLAASAPDGPAVRLNLINRSNDRNNSCVVIFGKNVATSFDEVAVAWQVIKNCGQGWNHPFNYPMNNTVGASDSYGNYSPQLAASDGQAFEVVRTTAGDTLQVCGAAGSPAEIDILNGLPMGAINAVVYKDGKIFATKTSVAPEQKAVFAFQPRIWIGVVSQIDEGQVMNAAIMSQINTEISLFGLASADIVMTGGGPGPTATPFTFTLQNTVFA